MGWHVVVEASGPSILHRQWWLWDFSHSSSAHSDSPSHPCALSSTRLEELARLGLCRGRDTTFDRLPIKGAFKAKGIIAAGPC